MCRPMASSMMTCALSRSFLRWSSTSSTCGLGHLLMMKLMHLVVTSPRIVDSSISICTN
ncbi:hypothetical protein HU200_027852 [Digitaria exilis]|uniref:Uncharacterized protein n=1 Tax=Digitaria exilis TaxID=1010633 RepID=A0A835ET89_9POAL|nr:hypothetical protein HU200_027852 [Digitaria exilis]